MGRARIHESASQRSNAYRTKRKMDMKRVEFWLSDADLAALDGLALNLKMSRSAAIAAMINERINEPVPALVTATENKFSTSEPAREIESSQEPIKDKPAHDTVDTPSCEPDHETEPEHAKENHEPAGISNHEPDDDLDSGKGEPVDDQNNTAKSEPDDVIKPTLNHEPDADSLQQNAPCKPGTSGTSNGEPVHTETLAIAGYEQGKNSEPAHVELSAETQIIDEPAHDPEGEPADSILQKAEQNLDEPAHETKQKPADVSAPIQEPEKSEPVAVPIDAPLCEPADILIHEPVDALKGKPVLVSNYEPVDVKPEPTAPIASHQKDKPAHKSKRKSAGKKQKPAHALKDEPAHESTPPIADLKDEPDHKKKDEPVVELNNEPDHETKQGPPSREHKPADDSLQVQAHDEPAHKKKLPPSNNEPADEPSKRFMKPNSAMFDLFLRFEDERLPLREIASKLNGLGYCTDKGERWTAKNLNAWIAVKRRSLIR